MKILSAEQVRTWDQYTIRHEPISSINLMERAAIVAVSWLEANNYSGTRYIIFCGKGNNGGDGLAIARLLAARRQTVTVFILEFGHKGTEDFQMNLARLHEFPQVDIRFIQTRENFHEFRNGDILIDALYGSGLNRKLEGVTGELVEHINESGCETISIDIPSGMFTDRSSRGNAIIKATHTLSFQSFKTAFLVAENADYTGEVHILDINLHPDFYDSVPAQFELTDREIIHSIYKPRKRFAHKGNYGHVLLVTGSHGKMGASVLSARACMRSGAGLLSCHIPSCGYEIMQTAVPEAMVITDVHSSINTKTDEDLTKYETIGIGPGLGTAQETKMLLREILDAYRSPVIIDADGLNILSSQKDMMKLIPKGSILTPHPKEFERLFGESDNDFDRIQLALEKAKELNCVIVLKGHHTLIATPDGKGCFNSTGNPGMATAGAGDVLTGILSGLVAQGYSSVEASILGVYLHGLAGDKAAEENSMEAMTASDITNHLGEVFMSFV